MLCSNVPTHIYVCMIWLWAIIQYIELHKKGESCMGCLAYFPYFVMTTTIMMMIIMSSRWKLSTFWVYKSISSLLLSSFFIFILLNSGSHLWSKYILNICGRKKKMKYSIVVDYEQRVSRRRERLDINIGSKCWIFNIMNQ